MDKFVLLVFSAIKKGCFCKYCTVFAPDQAGRGFHQGHFDLEPYVNWKNALEDFFKHQSNSYHREAVIWGENFLATPSRQKNYRESSEYTEKRRNRNKWKNVLSYH